VCSAQLSSLVATALTQINGVVTFLISEKKNANTESNQNQNVEYLDVEDLKIGIV